MVVSRVFYHIKEGVRSIFTHGLMSFAAVCMIMACLLIMGSFSLIAVNASHMLSDLEKDNEFLAYVDETYSSKQAQELQSELEAIENVDSVTYVSKETALAEFKAKEGNNELFDDVSPELLRDRYRIHVVEIEGMETTVERVRGVTGIADIQASLEIAEGFVMIRNVASTIAVALVVMLVIISVFIIANTIKIATFTRREEIAIMKMCGATNWFVRWPFIVEGVLLGVTGSILAYFIQWCGYGLIVQSMEKSGIMSIITALPFAQMANTVLFVFLTSGILIGAGGSAIAIRKFLKV